MSKLLAKTEPKVSLKRHSESVSEKTVEFLNTPGVKRISSNINIGFEEILELGEIAGKLHDVGKAHPEWQRECRRILNKTGEGGSQQFSINLPPHSSRSAVYTFEFVKNENIEVNKGMAVVLSVLHHHTTFTDESMNPETGREILDLVGIGEMVENLVEDGFTKVQIDKGSKKSLENQIINYRRKYSPSRDGYIRIAILSTLIYSALVQADHYVSAKESGYNKKSLQHLSPVDLNLFSKDSRYSFQKMIDKIDSSCLIGLAGCGEGKTHSAFQWGKKMIKLGKADRLVFAMPTQVTTNNLLLSIVKDDIIDAEKSTLYHSASNDFFDSEDATEVWDTDKDVLKEKERRWFQKAVTVTTIDNVLTSLTNGYKTSKIAKGNLLRSAIVFDEIHAYDSHTTGHILSTINILTELGIPWYVMTATLPKKIQDELKRNNKFRENNNIEIVESSGKFKINNPPRRPFKVSTKNDELDIDNILDFVENKNVERIMVVKNTVAEAKEIAINLLNRGENVTYYSSEFTRDDRKNKEEEIRKKFGDKYGKKVENRKYLVCTQVCEISLDLSADLILSDIAPIDAVIQRAGRLHRSGLYPNSNKCRCDQCKNLGPNHQYEFVVFSPLDNKDKWYPYSEGKETEEWKLLQNTEKVLEKADIYTFKESLEWINEAYRDIDLDLDTNKFNKAIRNDLLYGKLRNLIEDESDLVIREIKNRRINVLPSEYHYEKNKLTPKGLWNEYHNCKSEDECGVYKSTYNECKNDLNLFIQKYTVPIPVWWLHSDEIDLSLHTLKDELGKIEGANVLNIDYSYKYGVIPPNMDFRDIPKEIRNSNKL